MGYGDMESWRIRTGFLRGKKMSLHVHVVSYTVRENGWVQYRTAETNWNGYRICF